MVQLEHYGAASFSPQTHALPPASVATANNVTWHYPGSVNSQQLRPLPNEAAVLPRRKLWKMSAELAHQRSSTISRLRKTWRNFIVASMSRVSVSSYSTSQLPSDMGLPIPSGPMHGPRQVDSPILLNIVDPYHSCHSCHSPRHPQAT